MKFRIFLLIGLAFYSVLHHATAQVSFAPVTNYPVITEAESDDYPFGPQPRSLVAADLYGIGKVDLIGAIFWATPIISHLAVLTNNGSGVFGFTAKLNGGHNPNLVLSVDINSDGRADLVSVDVVGNLTIITNSGNGVFGSNATYHVGQSLSWATAADVNGDAKLDLICAAYSTIGELVVLTNNGNGIFGSSGEYPGYASSVAAADINGDTKLDLITANPDYNTLTIWTNSGGGIFSSNTTVAVGVRPGRVVAADVNSDGKVDLITANDDNTLTIVTNNGSGAFAFASSASVGARPRSVLAADLNGDGKPDLITANYNDSSLTVLTNDGSGDFALATTLADDWPFQVIAADVNGDGKLDLASVNQTQFGSISVFINNSPFPPPTSTPTLAIKPAVNGIVVSWPTDSAGWSLQQSPDLGPSNWSPACYSGYNIADDGMNKSLIVIPQAGNLYFRLLHPR